MNNPNGTPTSATEEFINGYEKTTKESDEAYAKAKANENLVESYEMNKKEQEEFAKEDEADKGLLFNTGKKANRREMISKDHDKLKEKRPDLEKSLRTAAIVTLSAAGIVASAIAITKTKDKTAENLRDRGFASSFDIERGTLNTEEEEDETPAPEVTATEEEEKPWIELTSIDEFDKTVDRSFDQSDDIGMSKTETKSETNQLGKYSKNSMAAPATLMNEYFGETMDEASKEHKAIGVEMTAYKQAESAAIILTQVQAEGFKGMSYIRAVEKIKGASDEERAQYQEMLKEIFANSEVAETTVGEIRDALRVAGQDEELSNMHYYINLDNNQAVLQEVKTGDEVKVLSFTYRESATTEYTYYFLERCYNGFQVKKVTNTETNEVTYEITVYEKDEGDKEKDAENLERIDNQIEENIEEDINTDDFDPGTTEDVTTEEQPTEKPSSDEYTGTGNTDDTIVNHVENNDNTGTDGGGGEGGGTETPTDVGEVSDENNYSENLGGANADNSEQNPVQPDVAGQNAADNSAIPVENAPDTGSDEFISILEDLGITTETPENQGGQTE